MSKNITSAFMGENGIHFMNTHFVSQIVTIFLQMVHSTPFTLQCGQRSRFLSGNSLHFNSLRSDRVLTQSPKRIERGRKLSLPCLNFFFAWLNDAKIGKLLPPAILSKFGQQRICVLFWSSQCCKPMYRKRWPILPTWLHAI